MSTTLDARLVALPEGGASVVNIVSPGRSTPYLVGLPSAGHRLVAIIDSSGAALRAAPLFAAFARRGDELLVHADRNDDAAAGGDWLDRVQLQVGEAQIGALLDRERPDAVIVLGDTNATLAGARAAVERFLPLIHVDAGVRTNRSDLPDECNRMLTDHMSQLLLAPTQIALENLRAEGVGERAHHTGDITADLVAGIARRLPAVAHEGDYVLAAIHDDDAPGDGTRDATVLACLAAVPCTVLLSLHPRRRDGFDPARVAMPSNVTPLGAVPYRHLLALERGARAIVTDAAAMQREAYLWGVPCVTLREETPWTETVRTGWNALVGLDRDRFATALDRPAPEQRPPIFGDGRASERIAALVADFAAQPGRRRRFERESRRLHAVTEVERR